ncbi:MAG: small basic protein [Candidatus Omnitrophota bacterium]
MSIHPSLAVSDKDKKQRSVLKRTERIRSMLDKGQWKEGDRVYGLPKIKAIRIKIKKEKAEKTAEASPGAEGAATAGKEPAAKQAGKAPEKK